ncbi:hypothetical protein C8Q77DRAFT_1126546 [Trametes polyzona]|nr:hypothetical protein C8Q77DRAFT_1126546 [Trametes polyzona]
MAIVNVPRAPELPGEAFLEIFIHPDGPLQSAGAPDPGNKFASGRHLEQLGKSMAEMAYMDVLFNDWPHADGGHLSALFQSTINSFMEKVVNAYRWKDRVRGCPPGLDIMSDPEESYRLFRTYAGAVHVEHGYDVLRAWIKALMAI